MAKHLANAFREAAVPGAITLMETLITIGATINTGSVFVTIAGALMTGVLSVETAKDFAKGLEKTLPEETSATNKLPEHKPK